MKLSIAWIFDHIKANWKDYDINEILSRFNSTTAEIERFNKVTISSLDSFFLVKILERSEAKSGAVCLNLEFGKEILIPMVRDSSIGANRTNAE